MTDRRVFGLAFAGLDSPNHHLTGVHTSPDLDRRPPLGPQPIVQASNVLLQPQCCIERSLRMVFVSNRRAEQGKDAVAG